MKSLRFVLLALFISSVAYAQENKIAPYTLEKAISTALEYSPFVLKAESAAESAAWKKTETYSGFLPSISVGGNYLFEKKYALTDLVFNGNPASVPQIIPTSQFILSAQLPIFDGFSSTKRWLAARATQRSAENDRDWVRFKTEREITLQFYQALGAELLRDVAVQNLKTIEDHLKDSRLFKKTGLSTNYDVLRVEVQESEARSELLNSEDNVANEKNKLFELMGLDQAPTELEGALPVFPDDLLKNLKNEALGDRPDLRAYSERENAQNHFEAAASTYWIPKVALFYQYQYYNNLNDKLFDWDHYRDAYQFGISASWNLFDGFYSFAKSKQSIEDRKQAEINSQSVRGHARVDLDFWKRKFGYFTSVYRSRLGDIEKATESVRLAKEGRKVGARTNSDLLDAEVELFRARANAVRAQLGAIESVLKIELASGQSVYRFY